MPEVIRPGFRMIALYVVYVTDMPQARTNPKGIIDVLADA
jgi:hypothetical protein